MKKKWDYDSCFELAKNCNSRGEFKIANYQAYHIARKNGWLDDYDWFIAKYKPSGFWTQENCYDEAKKYKTHVDFRKNAPVAYEFARRNDWLADYSWLGKGVLSEKNIYVVYCYKDEESNAVYVGLSNNLKQRHRQHCNGRLKQGERQYDIVYKYFESIKKDIPKPIILKEGLYANEAQRYEDQYVNQYQEEGKFVLNLAKAGSLGAYGKWTKQMCNNEAKKYKTKEEFKRGNNSAYNAARRNGWFDEYTWFVSPFRWTRELCFTEAKKYKTKEEFKRGNNSAYNAARRNGWFDEYTWFVSPFRWTRELCFTEAKKAKSKAEFKRDAPSAYHSARKNGWLDDYTWLVELHKPNGYWNRETCYAEAKKYKSRKEYQDNAVSAYNTSLKNKWLDDYTWFKEKARRNYWNRETCYAEAKRFDRITYFIQKSRRAYEVARKNGWLIDYTWFSESNN